MNSSKILACVLLSSFISHGYIKPAIEGSIDLVNHGATALHEGTKVLHECTGVYKESAKILKDQVAENKHVAQKFDKLVDKAVDAYQKVKKEVTKVVTPEKQDALKNVVQEHGRNIEIIYKEAIEPQVNAACEKAKQVLNVDEKTVEKLKNIAHDVQETAIKTFDDPAVKNMLKKVEKKIEESNVTEKLEKTLEVAEEKIKKISEDPTVKKTLNEVQKAAESVSNFLKKL